MREVVHSIIALMMRAAFKPSTRSIFLYRMMLDDPSYRPTRIFLLQKLDENVGWCSLLCSRSLLDDVSLVGRCRMM
jgi:hypothetical protein